MKSRIAVAMILCLLLSACGADTTSGKATREKQVAEVPCEMQEAQDEESVEENSQKEWTVNQIDMPDADAALEGIISEGNRVFGEKWGLANETVYRCISITPNEGFIEDILGYCVQTLEPPYTEWENHPIAPEEWVEGVKCRPWGYTFDSYIAEDGTVYQLLQGENDGYLGKWSLAEGYSATKIESDWLTESNFTYPMVGEIWNTGEGIGHYILYNDTDFDNGQYYNYQVIWLDDNYQKKEGLPDITEGYVWQVTVNPFSGKTYLCGSNSDGITVTNDTFAMSDVGFSIWTEGESGPIFTTERVGMDYDSRVAFCSETEGYLYNMNGVWLFSMENSSVVQIFSKGMGDYFDDMAIWCGADVRDDGSSMMLTMGAMGAYNMEKKYFLWELKEDTDGQGKATEKKVLELATTSANSFLKQAVVDFNKQSEEYEVVIRTAKEGESYDDFRMRIQAEMTAGGGPDLLNAGTTINLETGAQRGYLLNLSEAFAEYEDAILPSVWRTGQVDGELYAVPYGCQIRTLVTSTDVVGDKTSWSLQEAMECMEKSDATAFAGMEDAIGLFFRMGLMAEANSSLVDWNRNRSYLDSDEAVKLLEFAVRYADNESTLENVYQRIADREVLTYVLYLYGYEAIQSTIAMFEDKETYIGFPVEDGESGHLISGDSFAVNQACINAEGALEFLAYLVSEEVQAQIAEKAATGKSEFPVRQEALEQFFDYLEKESEKPEGLNSIGEFTYQPVKLTDENIDRLREMFRTARPGGNKAEKLMTVVEEELGNYFSGERSAKEVLDIVQNRAQLYLDEMQ